MLLQWAKLNLSGVWEIAMWRWLAIAATAYGLLGLAMMLAPRTYLPRTAVQDWQEILRSLQQEPGPAMPPGTGPPPGAQWNPGIKPLEPQPTLDFELPQTPFITRPELQAETALQPGGNHYLHWTPAPGTKGLAALILPWRPIYSMPRKLQLKLRADRATPVIIGLRERDGSVFSAERVTTRDWHEVVLPLNQLHLGPRMSDENGRLDLDQVQELVMVHFGREPEDQTRSPVTIDVDNIELR